MALILEYEALGKREAGRLGIPPAAIDAIVAAFCFAGHETSIHFRVRPVLPGPGGEFLLELAGAGAAGAAGAIVMHNVRHFAGAERFGLQVLTSLRPLRIALPAGIT